MRYEDKRINDIRTAYIGGGSRRWARTFMTDLVVESFISGTIRLYDIDAEASMANETTGNRLSQRPEVAEKWTHETRVSPEEALTGTDFMVIPILPGTFNEMAVGIHMPECLETYQSVGGTADPGDIIRALRTIPMYAEFTKAIRDYAPRIWVVNYTNPMSSCVKTLYHVFPQIKALGYCHEAFSTQKALKGLLGDTMGLKGINRKDICINTLGVDYFTWFDYASYERIDLFPIYRKYVDEHSEEGYAKHDTNWANACSACAHKVESDLLGRYGLIVATGDRHLVEFVPGDEYLEGPETVARQKLGLTSVDWWREDLGKCVEKSRRLLCGKTGIDLKPTGEKGILSIKALCGLERVMGNVNIPSTRLQIPDLLVGAMAETNAILRRGAIRLVLADSIPEPIKALIMPAVENRETILETVLTYNEELVVQAFVSDPQVGGRNCREEGIRKLVRDIVGETIKYLPKAQAVRK